MSKGKSAIIVLLLAFALVILAGAFLALHVMSTPSTQSLNATQPVNDSNDVIGGLRYRWVFVRYELDVPGNLEKVLDVMRQAKADGYNGIVFSNLWSTDNLENLGNASPSYIAQLNTVKSTARSLGLELYPTVLTVGYASPILAIDPNLVEGLPVKDALYVVHNGQATLVPDPPVSLPGGNFEYATNNLFYGWDSQSWPGTNTFADTNVTFNGTQTLRVEANGISRVYETVNVSPYRQYLLSFWVKTEGVNDTVDMTPTITGVDDNRTLAYPETIANSTQDWAQVNITFDSLDNSQVQISLGTWDWHGGTMWFADAQLQEIGMVNIIRRSEYPLVVESENGTIYKEGVDYEPVSDPLLGVDPSPGYYSIYHQPPAIILTPNSSIQEGELLRVSYYVAGTTDGGQVAISLTDPGARTLFQKELYSVYNILQPQGFFLNYNEIRVGNWEDRPVPMTEGQVIADSMEENENVIHSINPNLKVFVWSDMFDPYQNANDNQGLINGTCFGSYEGLGNSTVVNWNYGNNRTESLQFFADLGNPQILAGYYDGDAPPISQWLQEARSVNATVDGVMYTTWNDDYSQLDEFANDAWGNNSTD